MTRLQHIDAFRAQYPDHKPGKVCIFQNGPMAGKAGVVSRLSVAPNTRAEFLEARFHDENGWFKRSAHPSDVTICADM